LFGRLVYDIERAVVQVVRLGSLCKSLAHIPAVSIKKAAGWESSGLAERSKRNERMNFLDASGLKESAASHSASDRTQCASGRAAIRFAVSGAALAAATSTANRHAESR
jgi:hypothetical protein